MIKVTKRQVIHMHNILLEATGGSAGLRSGELLDSALYAPFHSIDGEDLYPTIEQKAARLGFGIIKNHPFVDGNKRIGLFVMLTFLELNGIELIYTQKELIDLGLCLADGTSNYNMLLRWVIEHSGT